MLRFLALLLVAALLVSSCTASSPAAPVTPPTSATQPAPQVLPVDRAAYATVKGIVDPANFSWPRKVATSTGEVSISQPPQRIHTLSLGYDEITIALVGPKRMAAVGTFTADANFSNVADQVQDVPKIARNAEQILGVKPDFVIASPFANTTLIKQLRDSGITVVQVDLSSNPADYEQNLRFMAYVYGEEARAEGLIATVRERLLRVQKVVDSKPASQRPRVLFYLDKKVAHGKNTAADAIITAAGGVNVAAEAGIDRAQETGLEAIVNMNPDYIIVWAQDAPAEVERFGLNPALHTVNAVHLGHIKGIQPKYIGTLSYWNVRGIEDLAQLLWPDDFKGVQFGPFN